MIHNRSRIRVFVFLLLTIVAVSRGSEALAAVHVTYDVVKQFSTDGFTASWLHSAESGLNGSPENGAQLNGATSSRIAGSLGGDLTGNVLSSVSGSVSGKLKQLAGYLNGAYGTSFGTYDPFELRFGSLAGGGGALQFETNGAGSGEFTGGYLDFALYVAGAADSLVSGTFFFKPQAESGSAALSPNRGTSSEFTLFGNNWMHDGDPVDQGTEPDWAEFLENLGYAGEPVSRTSGIGIPLGINLYVVDPDPPAPQGEHSPEPTGFVVWGLLSMLGIVATFRPVR
jgi:hypothetical protein